MLPVHCIAYSGSTLPHGPVTIQHHSALTCKCSPAFPSRLSLLGTLPAPLAAPFFPRSPRTFSQVLLSFSQTLWAECAQWETRVLAVSHQTQRVTSWVDCVGELTACSTTCRALAVNEEVKASCSYKWAISSSYKECDNTQRWWGCGTRGLHLTS